MKARTSRKQSGQTLIMVAIALLVLLFFVALAIDGGHLYAERRRMQNAADAGALAGAWEICFGTEDPWVKAQNFAEQNGAERYDPARPSETTEAFVGAWTVRVDARETTPTFIARVMGIDEALITASAKAACGEAASACGLWPVALAQSRWEEIVEAGGCENATPFYLWHGDNDEQIPDCEIYDCDVPDETGYKDGINDIVDQEGRAYLDFSDFANPEFPDHCPIKEGCGSDELYCRFLEGSAEIITIGDCLPGLGGTRAVIRKAVEERIGDAVSFPIFDSKGCGPACTGPNGDSYRMSGFGCATVLGWNQNLELPRLDGGLPPWKGKVIKVEMNCGGCETYCGGPISYPPTPWGVKAVSLVPLDF